MADQYRFRLLVGAKRQVTLPVRLLQLLNLEEGSQLQVDVDGDNISVVPLISVPRHMVSEALLREMEARRGAKSSDISFDKFEEILEADAVLEEPHSVAR